MISASMTSAVGSASSRGSSSSCVVFLPRAFFGAAAFYVGAAAAVFFAPGAFFFGAPSFAASSVLFFFAIGRRLTMLSSQKIAD